MAIKKNTTALLIGDDDGDDDDDDDNDDDSNGPLQCEATVKFFHPSSSDPNQKSNLTWS